MVRRPIHSVHRGYPTAGDSTAGVRCKLFLVCSKPLRAQALPPSPIQFTRTPLSWHNCLPLFIPSHPVTGAQNLNIYLQCLYPVFENFIYYILSIFTPPLLTILPILPSLPIQLEMTSFSHQVQFVVFLN